MHKKAIWYHMDYFIYEENAHLPKPKCASEYQKRELGLMPQNAKSIQSVLLVSQSSKQDILNNNKN